MKLEDRVAIVTGAAGGIGREFSIALANEGAKVVLADTRPTDDVVAVIRESGNKAICVETDVSDAESTVGMASKALEAYGGIDILVCNAGILTGQKPYDEITDEDWDTVMAVNVKGMWQCAKAVIPTMKKQRSGRIVNIASSSFLQGIPKAVHYVASKGAVIGFSRSLARELTRCGINVNILSPGFTITDKLEEQFDSEELALMKKETRASRIVQQDLFPADLIGALVFLVSDDSRLVSGQLVNVDGGVVHY